MTSQSMPGQSSQEIRVDSPTDERTTLSFDRDYNTVYERIFDRVGGDNGIAPVVACIAYALYKQEKRDWIVRQGKINNKRPTSSQVDGYVSTITEMRIDSFIIQANDIIKGYGSAVIDSVKFEINDEIYRNQFQALHDLIKSRGEVGSTRHQELRGFIGLRTKTRWMPAIGQGLIANLIWTFIAVVFLVSLNLGFDFNNFPARVKAFFNPPPAASTPSTPATRDGAAPPP